MACKSAFKSLVKTSNFSYANIIVFECILDLAFLNAWHMKKFNI
jgi:hypothetical protein